MIDTHTHVVADDQARYPLNPRSLSGEWYREAPTTADGLSAVMDEAGVAKAVLVQAVGAYSYDNDYAADSGVAQPDRFVSACCINPLASNAERTLEYWIRTRGMHGVRIFAIAREGDSWLTDPRTFAVWERARELGAHVIVTVLGHQLAELGSLLERFPEIPVSLDHCGFVPLAAPPWDEARPLFELAEAPNLHCKVSSIVLDAAAAKGADPASFVERLVGCFGAERVMWGSDFSQTHDRSYGELVALARAAFSTLSDADREQCFTTTAARLWPALAGDGCDGR